MINKSKLHLYWQGVQNSIEVKNSKIEGIIFTYIEYIKCDVFHRIER